jgi:hypothetical protein
MNPVASERTEDLEQESKMRKMTKKPLPEGSILEGGIDRIVARSLAPIQDEFARLRAHVEATRAW